jgi:hypothetical protein
MVTKPDDHGDAFDSYFHRLNNVLPERQELVSVGPDVTVDEALAVMAREGFSQLPIVDGREVLGAFTYRSFALGVARMKRVDVSDLPVFDFSEQLRFARPRDDFEELIDALDRDGAVFVGDPDRLIGNGWSRGRRAARRDVLPLSAGSGCSGRCTDHAAFTSGDPARTERPESVFASVQSRRRGTRQKLARNSRSALVARRKPAEMGS